MINKTDVFRGLLEFTISAFLITIIQWFRVIF